MKLSEMMKKANERKYRMKEIKQNGNEGNESKQYMQELK